MAYPSIQAPSSLAQRTVKPSFKGKSSAGYTITSSRATIAKKEFDLGYEALTEADRDTLQTYFENNAGSSFSWTHPESGGATYTVFFVDDEIEFKWVPSNYWSAKVKLREV